MDENWRVLIVEDDPDIASVLSRGIERAGFTPCLAGDTATAERIAGGGVDAARSRPLRIVDAGCAGTAMPTPP